MTYGLTGSSSFEDELSYDFALSTSLLAAKNILNSGSRFVYTNNSYINILILLFSACLYIRTFARYNKIHINNKAIAVLASIFVFWGISLLFFPELISMHYVRQEVSSFVIYSIPAFFILPQIKDYGRVYYYFIKIRWLLGIVCALSVILIYISGKIQDAGERSLAYSMSFGRALILPSMLFIGEWIRNKRAVDFFSAMLCCTSIILFGSRFPLLCIAFYVIVQFLDKWPRNVKCIIIPFFIVLLTCIVLYREVIFSKIYTLTYNVFGINSRILLLLAEGNISYDSGRFEIYTKLFSGLRTSPIIGLGAFGGIRVLEDEQPHSFIFDIFANFGYVGGSVFIVFSILSFINLSRHSEPFADKKEYLYICYSMFVPIAFIQTSLWQCNYFWQVIVLSCHNVKNELKGRNEHDE